MSRFLRDILSGRTRTRGRDFPGGRTQPRPPSSSPPVVVPEPQNPPIPGDTTGNPPAIDTTPGETTDTQTGTQDQVEADTRTQQRPRSCCNPHQFQYVWPIAIRPSLQPGTLRGMFQRLVCGPTEYRCAGGGTRVWADGLRPPECKMTDAKFTAGTRSPFIPGSGVPDFIVESVLADLNDEFSRYGRVSRAPNPPCTPCWQVGLIVIVNTRLTVPFFQSLCTAHIPAGRWRVEVRDMNSQTVEQMAEQASEDNARIQQLNEENYNSEINEVDRRIYQNITDNMIQTPGGPVFIDPALNPNLSPDGNNVLFPNTNRTQ